MSDYYKLIPSQDTMYIIQKFTFHKNVAQIPVSFALDLDIDFNLLTKALNIEIERNDSLRLRFKMQDKEVVQYFLPEYKIDSVKVLNFKTLEEQNKFFNADAKKPVRFLKDEIFRIYFFNAYNGYKGVFIDSSHLAIDAAGILVFFTDLFAVYKALRDGTEMPAPLYSYEDYLKKELKIMEDKDRYMKGAAFFKQYHARYGVPFYAGVHGPGHLEAVRKKEKKPDLTVGHAYSPKYDKALSMVRHVSPEDSKIILDFCKEHNIAPETLLLLAMRTYCSKLNYHYPDICQLVLCDKRITYKDRRTGGCMAQPILVRTYIEEDKTFKEALQTVFETRASLFKHLNFPYTHGLHIMTEMYHLDLTQAPAAHTFSWLPLPAEYYSKYKMEFKAYDLGRYFSPLYSIFYPDPQTNGISVNYVYRCKLITAEQVDDLFRNTIKIVLKGIENPDITIKELFDVVDV